MILLDSHWYIAPPPTSKKTPKRPAQIRVKLLNKSPNFVRNQNKVNKNELHNQMDELYRRIKVKAHFQDTRKQADLSDAEYRLKAKAKIGFLQKYTMQ